MASSFEASGYDMAAFQRGTDPVLRIFSVDQARQIVDYRGDENLQREIAQLAAKSEEGTLTDSERAAYEGYVRANKFVAILQAQARRMLATPPEK